MWLDLADRARLINLDFVQTIALERDPEGQRWILTAVGHGGVVEHLATYSDAGEANRALDRVKHALQTIVLSSDKP